jgi:predicted alpha/beta superfamily hydrolase
MLRLMLAALAAAFFCPPAAAAAQSAPPPPGEPIMLGTSHRLPSAALGEARAINVRLPASYAASPERRYPVLYLLDGGADQDFPHIAGLAQHGEISGTFDEFILVGITTRRRIWELTFPTQDERYTTYFRANGQSVDSRAAAARRSSGATSRTRSYRSSKARTARTAAAR